MVVQGDWLEARELATVTQAQGSPLERHMAVATLGNLACYQGDRELAWEMVHEILPRGPASEPGDALFPYAIETLRLAVRLALDESNVDSAREWLETHDRWLRWSSAVRGRAESKLLRAQLHQFEGNLERAGNCAEEALRLASEPRQPLVILATHRFLGSLAMDAQQYEEAEDQLRQALSLAESCAAPYECARTLLRLADLYLLTGRVTEVRPLLEDVRGIATGLEATPLITTLADMEARLETSTSETALTPREMDVLRLVTEGITDAEVAEKLYISPRTVGQHLRSIYNKLGVSSRTAATRRAVEEGLV